MNHLFEEVREMGHSVMVGTVYCNERHVKKQFPCSGCDSEIGCTAVYRLKKMVENVMILEKKAKVTSSQADSLIVYACRRVEALSRSPNALRNKVI